MPRLLSLLGFLVLLLLPSLGALPALAGDRVVGYGHGFGDHRIFERDGLRAAKSGPARPKGAGRGEAIAGAGGGILPPQKSKADSSFWPPSGRNDDQGRVVAIAIGEEMRDEQARTEAETLLGALGYRRVAWVTPPDVLDLIAIHSVVDRASVFPCGGPVKLHDWQRRLELAQNRLNMLDFSGSLAELSSLSLELACLDSIPRPQDLFLFSLVSASAHFLAGAAADPEQRLFHDSESRHCLAEAAAFAPDLPAPSWLDPDLVEQLDQHRDAAETEKSVLVQVSLTAKELWIDGVRLTAGTRRLAAGRHLVQAHNEGPLEASAIIDLKPRKAVLLRVAPHEDPLSEERLETALAQLATTDNPRSWLSDLLALVSSTDEALIVARGADGTRIWSRSGGSLVRLGTPETARDQPVVAKPRAPRKKIVPWTLGIGPSLQWTGMSEPPLDGLGGLGPGVDLAFRYSLSELIGVAVTAQPTARITRIPPGYDATWLVRLMIPARAGLRLGVPRAGFSPEFGLDGGLYYLGRFEQQELRGFGALTAGLGIPLMPQLHFQTEIWAGIGRGFPMAGGQILFALGARYDEHVD